MDGFQDWKSDIVCWEIIGNILVCLNIELKKNWMKLIDEWLNKNIIKERIKEKLFSILVNYSSRIVLSWQRKI